MAELLYEDYSGDRERKFGEFLFTIADSATDSETIDIRGVGNVCVQFLADFGQTVAVHVSYNDSTYDALYSRDGEAVQFTTTDSRAYDIPEAAGAHYMKFVAASAVSGAKTGVLMAKV